MPTVEPWIHKGKLITSIADMPEGTYGFVYRVVHIKTNRKYIGKKVLYFERKKKLTQKELAAQTGPGRKPTAKLVVTESDWSTYFGSNKELKESVKIYGPEEYYREILEYAPSKKLLTYYECKHLFINDVIEPNSLYYNDNILGKFFRRDFE